MKKGCSLVFGISIFLLVLINFASAYDAVDALKEYYDCMEEPNEALKQTVAYQKCTDPNNAEVDCIYKTKEYKEFLIAKEEAYTKCEEEYQRKLSGEYVPEEPSETESETPSENLQITQEETSTSISTHEKLVDKLLKAVENDDELKLFLLTLSDEETSELFTKNIQEEVGNEVWGKINRASRETDSYKSKVITILTKSLQEDDTAFVLLKHQDTKEWQQIIFNQVIQERIEKKKELKKEAEFEESMDSIRVRNARYEWMAEQREERDRLRSMSIYERFGESIQDLIPFQRLLNAKNFETLTDPNSYLYERLDAALGPLGFMLPVIGDVADFTTTMDMYKAVLDGKTDIGLGTFTLQYIGTFLPLYSFGGMKKYVNYAEDTLMYTGLGKSAIENIQPSRPPSSGQGYRR